MPATVFTIANQKGGVGKTTTAVNLSAVLAEQKIPTLLIDLDPQANATSGLGMEKEEGGSLYGPLMGEGQALDKIKKTPFKNLSIITSEIDLAAAEIAGESERAGRAEITGERAADLGRDTQRMTPLFRDQDGLDAGTVGRLEQQLRGSVDRTLGRLHPERSDVELSSQRVANRQVADNQRHFSPQTAKPHVDGEKADHRYHRSAIKNKISPPSDAQQPRRSRRQVRSRHSQPGSHPNYRPYQTVSPRNRATDRPHHGHQKNDDEDGDCDALKKVHRRILPVMY